MRTQSTVTMSLMQEFSNVWTEYPKVPIYAACKVKLACGGNTIRTFGTAIHLLKEHHLSEHAQCYEAYSYWHWFSFVCVFLSLLVSVVDLSLEIQISKSGLFVENQNRSRTLLSMHVYHRKTECALGPKGVMPLKLWAWNNRWIPSLSPADKAQSIFCRVYQPWIPTLLYVFVSANAQSL